MAATTVSRTEAARVFQQAIDKTIRDNGEVGMQVAVYHNGQPVVDVWGGIADETTGRAVDGETLFPSGRADMRRGCIPGAHGIMNARSSVRLFAMLANGGELDGVRLLSEERVRTFSTPRADTEKPDSVLGIPVRMGTAGFWLGGSTDPKDPFRLTDLNPRTLFHPGAGGAVAWSDPDARLAVAICHNGMSNNPSKTFQPIRAAVEQAFGVS